MKIRHTVIFTFYDTTTDEQRADVIARLNEMGAWLTDNLGVTDWVVSEHIPETFRKGRAHVLQDGVFPSLDAMERHTQSDVHKRVVELTPLVCDWMTVDTVIGDS